MLGLRDTISIASVVYFNVHKFVIGVSELFRFKVFFWVSEFGG